MQSIRIDKMRFLNGGYAAGCATMRTVHRGVFLYSGFLMAFLWGSPAAMAADAACLQRHGGIPTPFPYAACCLEQTDVAMRRLCLDQTFAGVPAAIDTPTLLAQFDEARRRDVLLEHDCHPVAHAIGQRALRHAGSAGEALRTCTDSCVFGCYHGVLERLIVPENAGEETHLTPEELRARLPDICTEDLLPDDSLKMRFQCLHGLGHAVTYTLGYDLFAALETCDVLPHDDRDFCHSGVFMENMVGTDKAARMVSDTDPLYPCSAVEERYKSRCMRDQTRILLERGWEDDAIADACRSAGPYAPECFEGFGRDISIAMRTDATRVIAACMLAGTHTHTCVEGVLHGLMDVETGGKTGFRFCAALTGTLQDACFAHGGEYLRTYHGMPLSRIVNECAVADAAEQRCRLQVMPDRSWVTLWVWEVWEWLGL